MRKLRICSVEKLGKMQTYNISVAEDPHNYVLANGLISKNSHAYSYGDFAVYGANIKHKHPGFFYAAYANAYGTSTSEEEFVVERMRCEADYYGIEILGPQINKSIDRFVYLPQDKRIYFGLKNVKGVQHNAVAKIVAEQKALPFSDLDDFLNRMYKGLDKTSIVNLAECGYFDCFGGREEVKQYLLGKYKKRGINSEGLFGGCVFDQPKHTGQDYFKMCLKEKELIGFAPSAVQFTPRLYGLFREPYRLFSKPEPRAMVVIEDAMIIDETIRKIVMTDFLFPEVQLYLKVEDKELFDSVPSGLKHCCILVSGRQYGNRMYKPVIHRVNSCLQKL